MITKNGEPIRSLEQWRTVAGPKRQDQWKEGRSALECARCWLAADGAVPDEIAGVLSGHPAFGRILQWSAEPEVQLRFDALKGEPRNADVLLQARDDRGELLVAIEAKVDETFGELVGDAMANALERKLQNARSQGIARVEQLASALFGGRDRENRLPRLAALRYQLLTATAGAARAAEKRSIPRVVMLVHEFRTNETNVERVRENHRDLELFLARLTRGVEGEVQPGRLYGPISIPGHPLIESVPELFIGKAVRCV